MTVLGEEFLAHGLDGVARPGGVRLVELDFDVFALAYAADAGKAEGGEGVAHRFPMGIEDARFQCDVDFAFNRPAAPIA